MRCRICKSDLKGRGYIVVALPSHMKRGPFCTGGGMLCADTALLQLKQLENPDAILEVPILGREIKTGVA